MIAVNRDWWEHLTPKVMHRRRSLRDAASTVVPPGMAPIGWASLRKRAALFEQSRETSSLSSISSR